MGKYRSTSTDGQVREFEAPDDATLDEIAEFSRQAFGEGYETSPVTEGAPVQADPENALLSDIGAGVAEIGGGALEGAANVLDHAADWTQSGLNSVGQLFGAEALGDDINSAWGSGKNELTEAAGAAIPAREGLGFIRGAGRFGGEVVASAPLAAVPGGPLIQGGVGGALMSDASDAFGVARDTIVGAIAGKGGELLGRGAAGIAKPEIPEGVSSLIKAGGSVTPGQYGRASGGRLGGLVARTEDRATSTPFVGSLVEGARDKTLDDFAKATINRAVAPIGSKLPENAKLGRGAIKWAGDKLSAAYDDVLPNLRVAGDEQFANELASIHADASTMLPERGEQFNRILEGLNRYWQEGVQLSGRDLKAIDTRLSERIRKFGASQDADQQDLGGALESVRDALFDLAARQNPAQAQRIRDINQGWKSLVQIERASANSKAAITPAGYSNAVKLSSDSVRRRGYSRGEALNQDLSDAASSVLPSDLGNSGTADRQLQNSFVGNVAGLIQAPAYLAAQGATAALTRQGYTSPQLARLLQYGARNAAVLSPAAVEASRNFLP